MSLLSDIGTAIGAGADIINYGSQVANQEYMKGQQEVQREREDTAVQRRVKDLMAAGLNPVLAAGSAATSSAPINVGVPKMDADNIMKGLTYENMKKQGALTDANKSLVEQQNRNANLDYENKFAEGFLPRSLAFYMSNVQKKGGSGTWLGDYMMSKLSQMQSEADQGKRSADEYVRNTDIARGMGVPSTSSAAMDAIGMSKIIDNAVSSTKVPSSHNVIAAILSAIKGAGSFLK